MNGAEGHGILRASSFHRSALLVAGGLGIDSDFPARRMNPSNFVHQWSTPQLLIHGSKDYRLPETEGIGAFHALQQFVLLD